MSRKKFFADALMRGHKCCQTSIIANMEVKKFFIRILIRGQNTPTKVAQTEALVHLGTLALLTALCRIPSACKKRTKASRRTVKSEGFSRVLMASSSTPMVRQHL